MSPRSEEFLAAATERLAAARDLLATDHAAASAALAYYAMLYAARSALSERGLNAKTHRGTWSLFHDRLVAPGSVDRELYEAAQQAQRLREAGDYEAGGASREEAELTLCSAERCVAAIEHLLAA